MPGEPIVNREPSSGNRLARGHCKIPIHGLLLHHARYDELNRIKTADSGTYLYTYSGNENKRILVYNGSNPNAPLATFNLYGPDGKRLGTYYFTGTAAGWGTKPLVGSTYNYLYLGNKALSYGEDRIGSNGKYYPYGTPYTAAYAEAQSFATYVTDESGLMYADQRFFNPSFGRFMTADRSDGNINYGNPTSWNRYVYTNGDPVNGMDPTGLYCGVNEDGTTFDFSDASGNDGGPGFSCAVAFNPYVLIVPSDPTAPDPTAPDPTGPGAMPPNATPPSTTAPTPNPNTPPTTPDSTPPTPPDSSAPSNPRTPTPVCYQGGCIIPNGPPLPPPTCGGLKKAAAGTALVSATARVATLFPPAAPIAGPTSILTGFTAALLGFLGTFQIGCTP